MNKFVRLLQSYLLYASPFVLGCIVWGSAEPESEIVKRGSMLLRGLWEILSWNLMLWFVMLVVFLLLMLFSAATRERTLMRIADLRERDELEQQITGQASRASYVSTLSLIIFFLFFSIFSVNLRRLPPGEAVNGNHGSVSINLAAKLLDEPRAAPDAGLLFEIPLSKTGILLILLAWQLGSFRLSARREQRRHLS